MTALRTIIAAASAALALAGPASAVDAEGRFAIEGGGLQTCGDFETAMRWRTRDVSAFGGWLEGYLTALNQSYADVYDLTPWQTTESLLSLLRSVCRQMPDDARVAAGVDRMVAVLLPQALRDESPVVAVPAADGEAFAMYVAVLDRIGAGLRSRGHDVVQRTGHFGEDTREGLRAVQAAAGLPATGLPDQRTLFVLLLDAAPRPVAAASPPSGG